MPTDSLDDIFGSSPPHSDHPPQTQPENQPLEPSELPSLRRQHVTAGYRDGISASKAEHVQHGFDAGFPVGAQLGMRAGTILGIIEGVMKGSESSAVIKKPGQKSSPGEEDVGKSAKREEISRLYRQASKNLDVQAVFADIDGDKLQNEKEQPEVQLLGKGDAVLNEWEKKVPVAAWEEHVMDVLEAKTDDGHEKDGSAGQS